MNTVSALEHGRAAVRLGISAALLVLLGAASPAAAEPTPHNRDVARSLANEAANAIAAGRYVDAEELLRRAYLQYPAPTIALLHARALVHLQRLSAALLAYDKALLATLAQDAPAVFREAVVQAARERDALRPRVPRLQVIVRGADPRSAPPRVTLDGVELSAARQGRWMLVDPGVRLVRAERGAEVTERAVRLREGQAVLVSLDAPAAPSSLEHGLAWGMVGVGALGLGVGVVTGLKATAAHDRADAACRDNACLQGSEGGRELERFRTYRVISTVGYVAGAASAGLGALLFVRSRGEEGIKFVVDERSALVRWQGAL